MPLKSAGNITPRKQQRNQTQADPNDPGTRSTTWHSTHLLRELKPFEAIRSNTFPFSSTKWMIDDDVLKTTGTFRDQNAGETPAVEARSDALVESWH